MKLFKKKIAELPEPPSAPIFHQILVLGSYSGDLILLHVQEGNKSFISTSSDGKNWTQHELKNPEQGFIMMDEVRQDINKIGNYELFPKSSISNLWLLKSLGFSAIDFGKSYDKYSPDFVYSLGIEFQKKITAGWFPETESELNLLFNYFANAPIRVGYFGPFKYVLKRLTDEFSNHLGKRDSEFMSHVAACLGIAYGRLEGFSSHTNKAPFVDFVWKIDEIRNYPYFNGYRFPKLKTIQYLMRKGIRFLKSSPLILNPLVATRFKVHALRSADFSHYNFGSLEDNFLQYQQLTNFIIYGNDKKLAYRDRDSRKIILAPIDHRHNLMAIKEKILNLTEPEKKVYLSWIQSLDGNHPTICHFAYAISSKNPEIEIVWNTNLVKTLFNSNSDEIQKALWEALQKNPTLFRVVPADKLFEFLKSQDLKKIEVFLTELAAVPWAYQGLINQWAVYATGRKLNSTELYISTFILQNAWQVVNNYIWNDDKPYRDALFLQVLDQTQLEPFDSWKDKIKLYLWDFDDFLGIFGIKATVRYPVGISDLLREPNAEKLKFFAEIIASYLKEYDDKKLIKSLDAFMNSSKPIAKDLAWSVLTQSSLSFKKIESYMNHLSTKDPTGKPYLHGLALAIHENDELGILRLLTILSKEEKDSFWRKNNTEVSKLFLNWDKFHLFYWSNLSRMSQSNLEKLRNFKGLSERILGNITANSISKFDQHQIEEFIRLVKSDSKLLSNERIVQALIIAPSAELNKIATDHIKLEESVSQYWLIMLESNLPIPQKMAREYLESIQTTKGFPSELLKALDSNNQGARKIALNVLAQVKVPKVLSQVISNLVENRNPDTWRAVSANLELIDGTDRYKEFTNQVFLSRRKAREVKELVKNNISNLMENITDAVEKDTLLRMAHSSVSQDREWALKQIAISGLDIEDVLIEKSWRS